MAARRYTRLIIPRAPQLCDSNFLSSGLILPSFSLGCDMADLTKSDRTETAGEIKNDFE